MLHCDVKPQNMLVNKKSIFKLCDFGISRQLRVSQSIVKGPALGAEAYLPVYVAFQIVFLNYILYF